MAYALPIIAVVSTIAGAASSVVGNIKQGQAAAQAAGFNQTQQEKNARITLAQGAENERTFRIQARKQLGSARAAYGASGMDANSGSAQDVLASSASEAEHDALKIRYGAELKAEGYRAQGQLYGMEANADAAGGYLSAAGAGLKGVSSAAYYGSDL